MAIVNAQLREEASRLLTTLLEGWSGAIEKLASSEQTGHETAGSQMANSVTVANPYSSSAGLRLESRSWQF